MIKLNDCLFSHQFKVKHKMLKSAKIVIKKLIIELNDFPFALQIQSEIRKVKMKGLPLEVFAFC